MDDINRQDHFGMTPLMDKVRSGDFEGVRDLLEAGADVNIKDNTGLTAIKWVFNSWCWYFGEDEQSKRETLLKIKDVLLEYGASIEEGDFYLDIMESYDYVQHSPEEESSEEFHWCVTANVREKTYNGPEYEIRSGTKHFAPGAKLYCYFPWDPQYIRGIGKHRNSKRLIDIVIDPKHLTNWRVKRVYNKKIIKRIAIWNSQYCSGRIHYSDFRGNIIAAPKSVLERVAVSFQNSELRYLIKIAQRSKNGL